MDQQAKRITVLLRVIDSHHHEGSGQRVQNEAEVFPEPPLVSLGVSTPTDNSKWQLWQSQPTHGKTAKGSDPSGMKIWMTPPGNNQTSCSFGHGRGTDRITVKGTRFNGT